jgi:hypothetical protein
MNASRRQPTTAGALPTGESISIWEDNWISSSCTLRPLFRPTDATVDKVSELIDGVTHQWDLQKLLANKFSQVDIDRIMQIPISGIAGEEWTPWAYEKSGLFTVKSAYRMLVSQPASSKVGQQHPR